MVESYAAGADEAGAAGAPPAGAEAEADAKKAYIAVNWVLSDKPLDIETELGLGFLDYLMLGTPAAPLRKALNDSRCGEEAPRQAA